MTTHIMVDLETWGTIPGSDIRSIGAVVFDPVAGTLGDEFYANVDNPRMHDWVPSDLKYPLSRDPATEEWWAQQSEAAQRALTVDVRDLGQGVLDFYTWWNEHSPEGDYARFWAHGPHFDEQILAAVFRAVARCSIPWHYRAPRDVRTMLEAAGMDPKADIPDYGTAHNALDDAKAQALAVIEAFRRLGRGA